MKRKENDAPANFTFYFRSLGREGESVGRGRGRGGRGRRQTQEMNVMNEPFSPPQMLPHLYYDANAQSAIMRGERDLKVVALVATRDIFHHDELFSTYFSVVPA